MAVSTPDVCRVTVVTPNRWADVALPAGEPLAELLPALRDHVGDADLEGLPLILQRLGDEPFDEDRSLVGNGVLDGETLYLNAADEALPTLDFDDAIAGLGAGIEKLDNRWKPLHTRRLLLGAAPWPAVVALVLLAFGPGSASAAALCCAAAVAVLLTFAALASRAWGDRTLALLLAGSGLPFAALFGGLAVSALGAVPVLSPASGLAAAVALFAAATLADGGVGGVSAGFSGAAFAGLLAALGCLVGVAAGWGVADTLALVLVLAVISSETVVVIACRLAGVFLPPLPRNAEELEEGVEPVPAQAALTRAAQVDQYLTALLAGSSALIVPCVVVVAGQGRWGGLLVLAACAASLLRMRVFFGAGQRAALLVAGATGPVVLLLAAGWSDGRTSVWVSAGCLVLAGLLFAGATTLPGRRTLPHVGRAAELAEWVVAASLLPLLLAVLGTYGAARNFR